MINRLKNIGKRTNVASVNTYESIKGHGGELKYQDPLVRGNYHDFWDNYSRREVVLADAVGNRVTLGFLTHVFQKFPKFVPNDEIQAEYIMDDVRQALEALGIKGTLIETGVNYLVSGWSLLKWFPKFKRRPYLVSVPKHSGGMNVTPDIGTVRKRPEPQTLFIAIIPSTSRDRLEWKEWTKH